MSDWIGALIGAAERVITRVAAHKRPKRNPILEVVKQAKQAGIHPLVALQGGFAGTPLYGSVIDWAEPLGLGEAIGGIGDAVLDSQSDAAREADYDRRRAEDRMFEREINNSRNARTPMDDYYEQLTRESQSRTRIMEEEHAQRGATIGLNSSNPNDYYSIFDGAPAASERSALGEWPKASVVQDEYDDWVSGPYGVLRFMRNEWGPIFDKWNDDFKRRYMQ